MYKLIFMSQAQKDAKKLNSNKLKDKTLQLIKNIQLDPLQYPPEYEFLKGDMQGLVSRRINKQHRLVYEIFDLPVALSPLMILMPFENFTSVVRSSQYSNTASSLRLVKLIM